jgi:hypothetical protein
MIQHTRASVKPTVHQKRHLNRSKSCNRRLILTRKSDTYGLSMAESKLDKHLIQIKFELLAIVSNYLTSPP